jgi:hypothetical protein
MWSMRPWVLLALLLAGCHAPSASLAGADRQLRAGASDRALAQYDRIAAQARTPAERVEALRGGARACLQLGRADAARERLERAVEPEVPGASEAALFELAELLRDRDRARALNLYYRAAAGAEHNLAKGWPWKAATDRILQLSMSR